MYYCHTNLHGQAIIWPSMWNHASARSIVGASASIVGASARSTVGASAYTIYASQTCIFALVN